MHLKLISFKSSKTVRARWRKKTGMESWLVSRTTTTVRQEVMANTAPAAADTGASRPTRVQNTSATIWPVTVSKTGSKLAVNNLLPLKWAGDVRKEPVTLTVRVIRKQRLKLETRNLICRRWTVIRTPFFSKRSPQEMIMGMLSSVAKRTTQNRRSEMASGMSGALALASVERTRELSQGIATAVEKLETSAAPRARAVKAIDNSAPVREQIVVTNVRVRVASLLLRAASVTPELMIQQEQTRKRSARIKELMIRVSVRWFAQIQTNVAGGAKTGRTIPGTTSTCGISSRKTFTFSTNPTTQVIWYAESKAVAGAGSPFGAITQATT